jgi:hypothetical protein
VRLLREARMLATKARFEAAEETFDRARAISADDPVLLDQTATSIHEMRTAYLKHNPLRRVLLITALGSLGADTSGIEDRTSEETGVGIEAALPLNVGGGANFRLGRFTLVGVSGSWGLVQDANLAYAGSPLEIYQTYQLTGSVGFRTSRSERRQIGFQFVGGPVWEAVNVNSLLSETRETSDSQAAFFLRVAAEWKQLLVFLQHGLGFDDTASPDTLVGWSNGVQFGTAVMF